MADPTLPVPAHVAGPPAAAQANALGWRAMLPPQVAGFASQPALARAVPALAGLGALAAAGLLWSVLAAGPERVLYTSLTDAERAKVVEALDTGGIGYTIDNATGAISVAENDLYRARMLVASDAGIAAPEDGTAMLDAMPMGTSRTLEGERLRLARERELMLTIREIDGIENVRVHLATPERSVFVRENSAPSASVMVRLVSGRSLSQPQVEAIVNLVAASVPGMGADAVRVVDHSGRLLSKAQAPEGETLALQREHEAKLREQVDALLLPLLGEGNFSAQVQVELDHTEVTSARETYEKEGVVRAESQRSASRTGSGPVGGVPGVTANTPPPDATLVDGAPQPAPLPVSGTSDTESAAERSYELGREVAVTTAQPGGLKKLSVAVAVSDKALKAAAPLSAAKLEALVSAAVGASVQRGDMVEVVASKFDIASLEAPPVYEEPWFAMLVRYGTALIAVLLVLLFAVRPLIGKLRGKGEAPHAAPAESTLLAMIGDDDGAGGAPLTATGDLPRQVELARRLASSQPERAVEALQRMLEAPRPGSPETSA
jgi:flagellar M-ring protein FliF